jgi:biopolymer transport protein TolQ
MGLLGTVWGVMSAFGNVALTGEGQSDGVSGRVRRFGLTVAGLLVAIPSMFGYAGSCTIFRVMTVELDNFAQNWSPKWKQNS